MAFPADWRGRSARAFGWLVAFFFVLWVLAGATPSAFVNEQAAVIATRLKAFFVTNDLGWLATKVEKVVGVIRVGLRSLGVVLGIPVAYVAMRIAAFWLPSTPVLVRKTLWFRCFGQRHRISIREVRTVFVADHPTAEGEVISLELRDGRVLPFCPVGWSGAGRLYRALLAAKQSRRARRSGR